MNSSLSRLKDSLCSIPDPRSKQGFSHPFADILALVLLGKIARQLYMPPIEWLWNWFCLFHNPTLISHNGADYSVSFGTSSLSFRTPCEKH